MVASSPGKPGSAADLDRGFQGSMFELDLGAGLSVAICLLRGATATGMGTGL